MAPQPAFDPSKGESSFTRIFWSVPSHLTQDDRPPSLHELFLAFQKDQLSVDQFGELIGELHGLRYTEQARRLLRDPNLSFQKFSRDGVCPAPGGPGTPFEANPDGGGDGAGCRRSSPSPFPAEELSTFAKHGAGMQNRYKDSAEAIIRDNSGLPAPPELRPGESCRRASSDVNQETALKTRSRVAKMGAGNPVLKTNKVSAGNPLLDGPEGSSGGEHYAPQEMAHTAIRLFIGGEIKALEFEQFLGRMGVDLAAPENQEVKDLVRRQSTVGDRTFLQFSKALSRRVGAANPRPGELSPDKKEADLLAIRSTPAAGVRVIPVA